MEQNYEGEFRIERMKSRIPWDMRDAHTHNYHEIYYLLSGTRRYFIGHKMYNVEEGDLIVVPRGCLHWANRRGAGEYDRYVVYFSEEFFAPVSSVLTAEERERFFHLGCVRIPPPFQKTMRRFFEAMEQEQGKKDGCTRLVQSCALGNIAALALRYGVGRGNDSAEKSEKIQEVAKYISENFNQEITLRSAAAMAYMEETYFSKQFKKLTGLRFYEYVLQIRMQQAAELLRNSSLPVGKIAELCGYSSGNYFGDAFRRLNGVSPTQFRKRCRGSSEIRRP